MGKGTLRYHAPWGGVQGPEPSGFAPDMLDRFHGQAIRRLGHTAVVAADGTWAYRELERMTAMVAERLRHAGVKPGSRVAVAMPRGSRELASLLAILEVGAAYVPIDASHPMARIRLILSEAQPQVLIAQSSSSLLSEMPAGTVHVPLDTLSPSDQSGSLAGGGSEPRLVALPGAMDHRPAYVLFTSGSTGRPKGVVVPRGALANFLRSMERLPGFSESERMLAITTTTFDIAALELFLPLWVGGTTIIADSETVRDPWLLSALIEREKPTMMQATPTTWRLLLESGWQGSPQLRMLCGGEAMPETLAARLLTVGSELWNMYGPTETTVWSTLKRIERASCPISIGKPIDHTHVYILDEDRKPQHPGSVGEIYIGGRGVARGYLNRPRLTAERFIADPFGPPGSRIYRTGDLGKLREDGEIECLGRIDHQVKIRGFRIELGEVESALRSASGVKEVLVAAIQRDGELPQLCGYWTGEAAVDALREAAKSRLPDYMVPTLFVHLEAFPINPNGKIDRGALPKPLTGTPGGETVECQSACPLTETEQLLVRIWGRVLGRSQVSREDDFFAMGGSSVKAVLMLNAVEKAGYPRIRVAAFLCAPTIAGLANLLEKGEVASGDESLVITIQEGSGIPLWLIHPAGGHVIYGEQLRPFMSPSQQILGIQSRGVDGRAEPLVRVEEMAELYLHLIIGRQPRGPYLLAGSSLGGLIALDIAWRLERRGEEIPLLCLLDAGGPNYPRHTSRAIAIYDNLYELLRNPSWSTIGAMAGRLINRLLSLPQDEAADYSPLPNIGADDAILQAISKVTRLNNEAEKRYVPAPYRRPLVLLRATQRPRWPGRRWDDPANGLGAFVPGPIEVVSFPCAHTDMLNEPHVRDVAHWIQRRIGDLGLEHPSVIMRRKSGSRGKGTRELQSVALPETQKPQHQNPAEGLHQSLKG